LIDSAKALLLKSNEGQFCKNFLLSKHLVQLPELYSRNLCGKLYPIAISKNILPSQLCYDYKTLLLFSLLYKCILSLYYLLINVYDILFLNNEK
jgi:hypothetical protein